MDDSDEKKISYNLSSYEHESERLENIRSKNEMSLKKYIEGKSYLTKLIKYRNCQLWVNKIESIAFYIYYLQIICIIHSFLKELLFQRPPGAFSSCFFSCIPKRLDPWFLFENNEVKSLDEVEAGWLKIEPFLSSEGFIPWVFVKRPPFDGGLPNRPPTFEAPELNSKLMLFSLYFSFSGAFLGLSSNFSE